MCVRMGSRRYWNRAYVPSQLQTNKGKELPYSSICQPARHVSCSYWYDCMCRLDGNVYIVYFTEIKCWACQAVMRWIKSRLLLLMHEAIRNHCSTLLREIGVLTKCHSLPASSLVPLSQGLCWSLSATTHVFTVNDWMLESGEPLYSYYCEVSKEPCGEITQVRTLLWISHGLAIADRSHAVIIMALEIIHNWITVLVLALICTCVFWCLHYNLFACCLQHHVFCPVIPVLIGLWLVHDLLEHCPLSAWKQNQYSSAHCLMITCALQLHLALIYLLCLLHYALLPPCFYWLRLF